MAQAQFNLGVAYAKGHGIPLDFVQAYKWFDLAAAQGVTNGASLRELVAQGMTPAQIAEALGEPSKKYDSGQWTFKRPMTFGFVNIHWQEDGTYDGHYNYERF